MELKMLNIEHSFGANNVLKQLDFEVGDGEIHALLGENGAGKSTLMNILGGVLVPDHGQIFLNGQEVHFTTPRDALEHGIGFVHQELSLINDLPVYLNLFLGSFLKTPSGLIDHQAMKDKAEELFNSLGLDLDPNLYVYQLDPSYKQLLEIIREYLRDVSLLILDEPTSSLSEMGIIRFFELVKNLQARGVTTIFISHKLGEVLDLCTHYTVLRDGKTVGSGKISNTSAGALAQMMVGHELVHSEHRAFDSEDASVLLELAHFNDPAGAFEDVNLKVNEGEILGVTGLQGDGRSELFRAVFGDLPYEGKLFWEGVEIQMNSTHQAKEMGIAYVPRDRKENAIAPDLSIFLNGTMAVLEAYSNQGWIKKKPLNHAFEDISKKLQIKMSSDRYPITSLSGGNQQKVVLARWLMTNPRLLILDNPTQGVDVGVKEEIYKLLEELRELGLTVVVLSNEADEIVRICDRAYVMFHGKIATELSSDVLHESNIMHWATGAGFLEE